MERSNILPKDAVVLTPEAMYMKSWSHGYTPSKTNGKTPSVTVTGPDISVFIIYCGAPHPVYKLLCCVDIFMPGGQPHSYQMVFLLPESYQIQTLFYAGDYLKGICLCAWVAFHFNKI